VWDRVLDDLRLHGDETVLDLGCGRGAVLLAAANRLPRGRAIGVDLWRADQTDNSREATLANAALEDVAERIELHTADMTALPLADNSVDVIVSNLAIHNIPTHAGMRPVWVKWVGEMCGAATSDGGCGTAAGGFPRAWSPRRSRPEQLSANLISHALSNSRSVAWSGAGFGRLGRELSPPTCMLRP
jgi:SAM-dependent methyltransferase